MGPMMIAALALFVGSVKALPLEGGRRHMGNTRQVQVYLNQMYQAAKLTEGLISSIDRDANDQISLDEVQGALQSLANRLKCDIRIELLRSGVDVALLSGLCPPPTISPAPEPEPEPETSAPETPAPDTLAPETPAPETPAPETPAPETPAPEPPAPETPAPETPAPETPAPETPAPETPAPETPAPETPAPETPAPEIPAPETPAPEPPAPETPEPETPAPETPAPETPAPETPAPEPPAPETPAPKTPAPEPPTPNPEPAALTPEEARRLFNELDDNASGYVFKYEVKDAVRLKGFNRRQSNEVFEMFDQISGLVDFVDFKEANKTVKFKQWNPTSLLALIEYIDRSRRAVNVKP